jgi:anti-sigma-K factor RskA
MSVHEQFADDLVLYALGALQGEERLAVERHLGDCPGCRRELEESRGDLALLALSASGAKPPLRSRERLIAAISKEPRPLPAKPSRSRAWWMATGWATAAAMLVIGFVLVRENSDLRRHITEVQTNSTRQVQQLDEAKQLIATLTSAEAEHFTLVASKTSPQPQGKAIYVRSSGTLVFLASNMPVLPPQKTYELWLIPATGAPIPAGLFKPNQHGSAAVVRPPVPPGTEAKTFAITIEPEAGSSAPTSTPIMVGIGG